MKGQRIMKPGKAFMPDHANMARVRNRQVLDEIHEKALDNPALEAAIAEVMPLLKPGEDPMYWDVSRSSSRAGHSAVPRRPTMVTTKPRRLAYLIVAACALAPMAFVFIVGKDRSDAATSGLPERSAAPSTSAQASVSVSATVQPVEALAPTSAAPTGINARPKRTTTRAPRLATAAITAPSVIAPPVPVPMFEKEN